LEHSDSLPKKMEHSDKSSNKVPIEQGYVLMPTGTFIPGELVMW
jgi:hypothetical protein